MSLSHPTRLSKTSGHGVSSPLALGFVKAYIGMFQKCFNTAELCRLIYFNWSYNSLELINLQTSDISYLVVE